MYTKERRESYSRSIYHTQDTYHGNSKSEIEEEPGLKNNSKIRAKIFERKERKGTIREQVPC